MVKRWFLRVLRPALAVGILVYLYKTGQFDLSVLRNVIPRMGLFLVSIAFMWIGALLAIQRWRILVRAQDLDMSPWTAFKLSFIGFFFGAVLPGTVGGDVVKAYYVTRGEQRKTALITPILLDRLLGLYTLLLVAAGAVLYGSVFSGADGRPGVWAQPSVKALGVSICVMFIMSTVVGALFLSRTLRRSRLVNLILQKLPFSEVVIRVYDSVLAIRRHPALFLNAFVLSLSAQLLSYVCMYCLALVLDINSLGIAEYVFVLPLCNLVNAIPLTPGGFGVGEAGFRALFLLFGSARGAELALLYHLEFFLLSVGVGGLVYMFSDYLPDKVREHPTVSNLSAEADLG
ncbi:MAG: flippase-like domain-containing protein [Armatimonadetes bacterium]|nr:flippase-like domain-containing protein [Armatimonadota bacterium]